MRRASQRPVAAFLVGVVVAVSALAGVLVTEQPATAASPTDMLKTFNPADIISDEVMYNSSTMSATTIQSFLNAQVPTCRDGYTCLKSYTQTTSTRPADPMCRTYTGAKNETGATIIARVAKACGVNPQVLLVTLEKEQSLVTDDWPSAQQYRAATGYGCPDTSACDSDYYGFYNQVYKAAWAFKRYTMPKGTGPGTQYPTVYNWFPVGKPVGVLFNPDPSCGATTLTLKNEATAVLYYFTPYQPNAAAKAAGYGTGDRCSAYGNRNFFLHFTSWFGSTHYTVAGAIGVAWRKLGGAKSSVGNPVANSTTVVDGGGGTVQRFKNGTIYSSLAGTFAVTPAVVKEYTSVGGPGGVLGWPRAAATHRSDNGGGSIQAFENGSIYSSAHGTDAVTGAIYNRYAKESFQAGRLGWPKAEMVTSTAKGGGTWQSFTGGRIFAAKSEAGYTVLGPVLTKYLARGAEASSLGWPTAPASTVRSGGTAGTVQNFQYGQVQAVGTTVRTVTGALLKDYVVNGGAAGALGWATSVARQTPANGGGWYQAFAGGTIYYSATSGAHPLKGKELALYTARGGVSGSLGWPGSRTRVTTRHGGAITVFTNGRIYSSSAGTVAVLGEILAKYLAKGGQDGKLGWPTGGAHTVKGVLVQTFEHGTIRWSAAVGAKATVT